MNGRSTGPTGTHACNLKGGRSRVSGSIRASDPHPSPLSEGEGDTGALFNATYLVADVESARSACHRSINPPVTRIVSARSDPVDTIAIGTPVTASIRCR